MSTETTEQKPPKPPYQFYVSSNVDGLWVVDLESTPPRLLNHSSLQKHHFKKEEIEHDIGDRTIKDFMEKELEAKHIKEMRTHSKYIFSTKLPFCSWSSKDTLCQNYAMVFNGRGLPMCKRHYSFGNNK